MDIKQMIGARIAQIRNKRGMTQEQLAGKMDISSKYLSSIERGKENPTLDTFINLSQSLNVDLGDIFTTLQIEDPVLRRTLIKKLLEQADDEQLKITAKILTSLIR